MPTLTYGQVEEVLASMTGIHPTKRAAFQSRLKQWQKMNFPEGVNVGRGVRADYGASQLYQLALMIEVIRAGLPPERGIDAVKNVWGAVTYDILYAARAIADDDEEHRYTLVRMDALQNLIDPDTPSYRSVISTTIKSDDLGKRENLTLTDFDKEDRTATLERFLQERKVNEDQLKTGSIIIDLTSLLLRSWRSLADLGHDLPTFAVRIPQRTIDELTAPFKAGGSALALSAQRFLGVISYEAD